jgi:RNA polymerase sigma-70 factor (ECF subfamily)
VAESTPPAANPSAERDWLIRVCARLSGDGDAAEDLAQETLLEAWRQAHKLESPDGRRRWLAAIARNVCLRWRQRRQRRSPVVLSVGQPALRPAPAPYELLADPVDLEVELERAELASLLDRALALLPPITRRVLVEKYVEQSPQAEIAARLGLSEGAVEVRLYRGKLALRRLLTTDLRQEVSGYRAIAEDRWEETRIWCPVCGLRKLHGRFGAGHAEFELRCPDPICAGRVGLARWRDATLFSDLKSYRPALSRLCTFAYDFYHRGLEQGSVPCFICGKPALPRRSVGGEDGPMSEIWHGLEMRCTGCNIGAYVSLGGLVLCSPEGQRFWREQQRIVSLPAREVEVDGRPALVTTFASRRGAARLDVISARDTFQVLGMHGTRDD